MIAHIGALPLEELLPVLTGAGSGLLAVRAWMVPRVRRRRDASTTTCRETSQSAPAPSTTTQEEAMHPHLTMILADQRVADMHRVAR